MTINRSALCGLIPAFACAGVAIAQPRFVPLGSGITELGAISADGRVVVGSVQVDAMHYHAVRWTAETGAVDINSGSVTSTSWAETVSADGSVITGTGGWMWTPGAGMQPFTIPDHNPPSCRSLSRDGTTMGGYAFNSVTQQFDAFVWTASGGVVLLPNAPGAGSSKVAAIAPAVNLAVGSWSTTFTSTSAYAAAWSPYTTAIDLSIPGLRSDARAVTPDGTIIVGRSGTSGSVGNATIWTAQGPQVFPNPANRPNCSLHAINDVGDFASGNSSDFAAGPHAVVWRRAAGMLDGQAFLTSRGVVWSGLWIFQDFAAMTPDGRTIAGSGAHYVNAERLYEAFIIYLCSTADFNHDGDSGGDADIEAFFACLAGDCCPTCDGADINNDGDTGTDADIESFFRILAGQPC